MNKKFRNILAYGCLAFSMMAMPSCVGDLDMKPNDPNSKTELNSAAEYEGFFYQLYNGLVVSGPQGGSDITVEDGGAYKWSWKGGALRGRSIPDYRKVYAIPTKFVPTLGQNEGY